MLVERVLLRSFQQSGMGFAARYLHHLQLDAQGHLHWVEQASYSLRMTDQIPWA